MSHLHYMNTQLIFRDFKLVTENAYANQNRNRNRVGREDIALWTKIAEKVVNVSLQGKLSKLFVFDKFLCT